MDDARPEQPEDQRTDDERWPRTCPECGTELEHATIDFGGRGEPGTDPRNDPRNELNPGEMAQVDYCPNPDCPTNQQAPAGGPAD
jgi:hypothetical protein